MNDRTMGDDDLKRDLWQEGTVCKHKEIGCCAGAAATLVLNIISVWHKKQKISKSKRQNQESVDHTHDGFSQVSVLCATADVF